MLCVTGRATSLPTRHGHFRRLSASRTKRMTAVPMQQGFCRSGQFRVSWCQLRHHAAQFCENAPLRHQRMHLFRGIKKTGLWRRVFVLRYPPRDIGRKSRAVLIKAQKQPLSRRIRQTRMQRRQPFQMAIGPDQRLATPQRKHLPFRQQRRQRSVITA